MKLESISIKRSDRLTEKWVQDQIADDPTILGLGDLVLKDKERMQPRTTRSTSSTMGLGVDGAPLNFVTFMPRKAHVIMTIKLPKSKEFDEQLEEAGIETLPMIPSGGSIEYGLNRTSKASNERCFLP